ncbi:hypothetical protein [Sedimenticola sp.]|uniref:hypothetical protein n=1 Tax=Sedimenticola sp. TaxID=1940285 RepID=UPI003D10EBB6
MKYSKQLAVFVALFLTQVGNVIARDFNTRVSTDFHIPRVLDLYTVSSQMQTHWFVDQAGGRTVYSNDVLIGTLTNGRPPQLYAHATWVINFNPATNTINIRKGKTHITNWFGNQRCNVYEDGTCNCNHNPNWNICGYPPMASYVTALHSYAVAAALNAKLALQAEGYTVVRE